MGNTIALMYDFRMAKLRSELLMNIRKYFIDKDYLEVSTPTLSPYLIPEPTIKTFRTEFINPFMERTSLFMIPSPEIFMKKLLAAGSGSIFQISQCFRRFPSASGMQSSLEMSITRNSRCSSTIPWMQMKRIPSP